MREPNALEVPADVTNRVRTPLRSDVATTNDHEAIEATSEHISDGVQRHQVPLLVCHGVPPMATKASMNPRSAPLR
jgi:hypothetical protein